MFTPLSMSTRRLSIALSLMCVMVYVPMVYCLPWWCYRGRDVGVGWGGGGDSVVRGGEWVQDAVLSSNDALLDALNNSSMHDARTIICDFISIILMIT
jgi:hypothetical protein